MSGSGRILAVDYGTKKVGVAITDPLRITASPLTTLRYKNRDELLARIRELVKQYEVVQIIVGLPLTLSGGKSEFTKYVEKFIDWLSSEISIPVTSFDESGTSLQAKQTLIAMGVKTGHNKDRVDAMAAAHMLRYYLDMKETG